MNRIAPTDIFNTRSQHANRAMCMIALLLAWTGVMSHAAAADDPRQDLPRAWSDRLDDLDRQAVEANLGYAPPPIPGNVSWHGHERVDWEDLRGKVVVVQSWTNGSRIGRAWFDRAQRLDQRVDDDDVVVLTVHTPKEVERAERFITRRDPGLPVLIDEEGVFSDTLGFYRRPTNIVIDRQGAVRYAGVNERGLFGVTERLLEESFDEDATPPVHPEDEVEDEGDEPGEEEDEPGEEEDAVDFPPHNDRIGSARDLQGESAPQFHVERWITDRPQMRDRVIVLEFWATWCGPCRNAIPHLNQLQRAFPREATVIGVSDEGYRSFEQGRLRHNLRDRDFEYALAIDSDARMKNAFGVRGIPHTAVISRDGVVRWQGHPSRLQQDLLGDIVEADQQIEDVRRQRPDADADIDDAPHRRVYRWTERPDSA